MGQFSADQLPQPVEDSDDVVVVQARETLPDLLAGRVRTCDPLIQESLGRSPPGSRQVRG